MRNFVSLSRNSALTLSPKEATSPTDQLHAIVGYSKYHKVRIDNQAETDTIVPDLVAQGARGAGCSSTSSPTSRNDQRGVYRAHMISVNIVHIQLPLPRDYVGWLRGAKIASRPRGPAVDPNDDDYALSLYTRSSITSRSTAAQQGQRSCDAKECILTARSDVTFMTDGSNECQRFANLNRGKLVIVKLFINCSLHL
ncbi:hypothetical protein PF004_g26333 [Phytophthora fragariae]|uniref:Uncharacterized protein n=2 Tax=Phytophthora fragariae TaxID=53985 RepID=A0A6G0MNZ1_9STRA|nr:hypothetical protein PF004_g26333 [Phytophthora fragariae]